MEVGKDILINLCYSLFVLAAIMVFPKSRNLVVFGSKHGSLYSENSKHLFEWIRQNRPEINCLWLTRNNEVENVLKKSII